MHKIIELKKTRLPSIFKKELTFQNFGLNLETLKYIFMTPILIFGLFMYVTASLSWLKVLVSSEISIAFPLWVSIGFILNAIVAFYLFHEDMSMMKITGMSVILIGIFITVGFKIN